MKLTFAIPTWKRPDKLEICVRSIAEQVRDGRTEILISEDVDDAETTAIIEKLKSEYGFIRHERNDPRSGDYSVAFKSLFQRAEGDWTWMFGDDDRLEKGALAFMLEHLEKNDGLQFLHVAEVGRESGNSGFYKGDLWTLCNSFGLTEMTGFITGNIVRTTRLLHATQTPRWNRYAKSAFVQSCILLEELKDAPCGLLDIPLVATQDQGQTDDTMKRWAADNISGRYLYLADAIELMYDDGILTEKVSNQFWRYLNIHMWSRYIAYSVGDYLGQGQLYADDMWGRLVKMASYLKDEDEAKRVISAIEAARGLCTLHSYMSSNLDGIKNELESIIDRSVVSVFPYSFVKPMEAQ